MKKVMVLFLCVVMIFSFISCNTKKYENIYVESDEPERNAEGLTWPEGQALPNFAYPEGKIDAVNTASVNADVKAMMVSLQGLINKKKPQIILYSRATEQSEKWLEISGIEYDVVDYKDALLKYKDEISGIIIYDKKVKDTVNLADTLAGFENAIVCTEKQAEELQAEPYNLPVIENYVGKFKDKYEVYTYLYDNLWSKCTKRLLVGLSPDSSPANVRDLAIAANAAIIWLDPRVAVDKIHIAKFLGDMTPGEGNYIGWWAEEGAGVQIGSEYGIPTIPADYYENYSIYSATSRELNVPTTPAKPDLENKFYIAMTLTEGDNLQYCQHVMKTKMWDSRNRGEYPISWTCAPVLLDAGPALLNYYYETATDNDCIISGPSGVGYTDPLRWNTATSNIEDFKKYCQRTETYLRKTGINVITVWNRMSYDHSNVFSQYMPSLVGFTLQALLDMQEGQRIVDNRIPAISTHPYYDGDIPRVQGIIEGQIDNWINEGERSPRFMIPQMESWSCEILQINNMADYLKEKYGDKVEFVRIDHLMMLYNENANVPYNIALQAENITASGEDEGYEAAKAVNGSTAKEMGWKSSNEDEKWLMIDLQEEYKISRYNVVNAGSGYYSKDLNTVSFKIQYSSNGKSWKDVDTVKDNKSNVVDKYVDEFEARYVRIFITEPGSDGAARIQELEFYGVKV